jgi:hypothetical protein
MGFRYWRTDIAEITSDRSSVSFSPRCGGTT